MQVGYAFLSSSWQLFSNYYFLPICLFKKKKIFLALTNLVTHTHILGKSGKEKKNNPEKKESISKDN